MLVTDDCKRKQVPLSDMMEKVLQLHMCAVTKDMEGYRDGTHCTHCAVPLAIMTAKPAQVVRLSRLLLPESTTSAVTQIRGTESAAVAESHSKHLI